MSEYSTEQVPEFDVGVGNFATRNKRYRTHVCNHFKLKFVSVGGDGGDGNCFFESLSRLLQPHCTAAQLRENCVELFKSCLDSTQPLFETIVIEIEDELNRELICSKRGSRIDGLKPGSVQEYIDAVSHDGVWVQGLHWMRAVSFLYDVRIGVVIYGQELVRFIGSGQSTVFLYNADGRTHFDPLVPWTGSPDHIDEAPIDEAPIDEAPIDEAHIDEAHIDEAHIDEVFALSTLKSPKKLMCALLAPANLIRLARRFQQEPSVVEIHSDTDDASSVHGLHGSQPVSQESSVHASPLGLTRIKRTCRMECGVHGSQPVLPESSVHGLHGSQPVPPESSVHASPLGLTRIKRTCRMECGVHGSQPVPPESSVHGLHGSEPVSQERIKRACRLQKRAPSPDPPARLKKNAHVKKIVVHGSNSDDDEPLVLGRSKPQLKNPSELALSVGTSFTTSHFSLATAMLKKRLAETHSGGHLQTRNSSAQYIYIKCLLCPMVCSAGSKKGSPNRWRVTSLSNVAHEACKGHCHSDSVPISMPPSIPTAMQSAVIPTDFPEGPEVQCSACTETFTRATQCPQGHAWCITCFAYIVGCQCSPTDDHLGIQKFLAARGVVCTCCPPDKHSKPWTFDIEQLRHW